MTEHLETLLAKLNERIRTSKQRQKQLHLRMNYVSDCLTQYTADKECARNEIDALERWTFARVFELIKFTLKKRLSTARLTFESATRQMVEAQTELDQLQLEVDHLQKELSQLNIDKKKTIYDYEWSLIDPNDKIGKLNFRKKRLLAKLQSVEKVLALSSDVEVALNLSSGALTRARNWEIVDIIGGGEGGMNFFERNAMDESSFYEKDAYYALKDLYLEIGELNLEGQLGSGQDALAESVNFYVDGVFDVVSLAHIVGQQQNTVLLTESIGRLNDHYNHQRNELNKQIKEIDDNIARINRKSE